MAYKDSGEIANNSNYALGDYSFRIERSSVPGSTNDKIEAICTKDGKNARKSIQVQSSTQMLGWYVEANETEASVYATVKVKSKLPPGSASYPLPITSGPSGSMQRDDGGSHQMEFSSGSGVMTYNAADIGQNGWNLIAASSESGAVIRRYWSSQSGIYRSLDQVYTFDGRTVYYTTESDSSGTSAKIISLSPMYDHYNASGVMAWLMIYGDSSGEDIIKEIMVGRFAIDIEDAGGVGPGSDWIDPGDYDPDWEPEDPTHTLYVTIAGALSGRHNDPIEDPSYSYIPADKDTVKDYGCGGDGGHGGGGGAGASTVVIHKFATNQANSKEVTAIARRHGYGSGGGKGGKGGDGCILVYY